MNREEFLSQLRNKLKRLPPVELEQAMNYYEEYFNEAGVDQEKTVLSQLGSPEKVAAKIIGEYAINDTEKRKKPSLHPLWVVILAICASPLALPLAFAGVMVLLALLIALFAVFFAVGISAVALTASGILAFIGGFFVLFTHLASGVFFLGFGMFGSAVGLGLLLGIIKLTQLVLLKLQKLLGNLLLRRGTR